MTTVTREHLELAAKAAGYVCRLDKQGFVRIQNGDTWRLWQPHKDTADAWQLAADCEMRIDFDAPFIAYRQGEQWGYKGFGGTTGRTAMEAVTLAAAEIGRAMG